MSSLSLLSAALILEIKDARVGIQDDDFSLGEKEWMDILIKKVERDLARLIFGATGPDDERVIFPRIIRAEDHLADDPIDRELKSSLADFCLSSTNN